MPISKRQLAVVHIAKKRLHLSEDIYRRALLKIGGVTSAAELDREGFHALMGYFDWCGLDPSAAEGPDFGARPGMASYAQVELIRMLWREYTRGAYTGEEELNKWLLPTFKVSSLRFLTKSAAQGAITALKAMKGRRGAGR